VTAVVRLPLSWISSMADWYQVPAVSTVTGRKMREAEAMREVRGDDQLLLIIDYYYHSNE